MRTLAATVIGLVLVACGGGGTGAGSAAVGTYAVTWECTSETCLYTDLNSKALITIEGFDEDYGTAHPVVDYEPEEIGFTWFCETGDDAELGTTTLQEGDKIVAIFYGGGLPEQDEAGMTIGPMMDVTLTMEPQSPPTGTVVVTRKDGTGSATWSMTATETDAVCAYLM